MIFSLVELLNSSLERREPEEPRTYIGASAIGKECLRQIWYSYKGYPAELRLAKQQRTLNIGKTLEDMIIDDLKAAGVFVISRGQFYQDDEVHQLQGHVDGVIVLSEHERAILEIKTAKDDEFKKFVKLGLRGWNESYYSQIQCYMGMSGIHEGVLLAINKDTSDLHEQWINHDIYFYDDLKNRARIIAGSEQLPPRIASSAFDWRCKMCSYNKECYKS